MSALCLLPFRHLSFTAGIFLETAWSDERYPPLRAKLTGFQLARSNLRALHLKDAQEWKTDSWYPKTRHCFTFSPKLNEYCFGPVVLPNALVFWYFHAEGAKRFFTLYVSRNRPMRHEPIVLQEYQCYVSEIRNALFGQTPIRTF